MYEIHQQQHQFKLLQTFPQEHSSDYWISSLLQINPHTLISSSDTMHANLSDIAIVIWSKSKSPQYEPIQRITGNEAGGGIERLVLLSQKKEDEAKEFASCSRYVDGSIRIWRRGKGDKFKIKQKITNVKNVQTLLYISFTNELISGYYCSPLLQIWSPSSSSSSQYKERQKIETSSSIYSLLKFFFSFF